MAEVLAGSVGIDPADVSGFEQLQLTGGLQLKFAIEDIDEFGAFEDLGGEFALVAMGKKLGEAGHDVTVRDERAQAFGDELRIELLLAGDGDAVAFGEAAELDLALLPEEAGEIFSEDHGNAGKVADGGDDAAGFKLREEAGGEAGETTEFDEAHGAAQAHGADTFSNLLVVDLLLDAGGIDDGGIEVGTGIGERFSFG